MNNAYGNNTIQDLCEDTSTSNLEANNLYMDHAQCIAYQDITVTLTSKLTPTAPEFIPRNAVPFCIVPAQSNNISGAECQDHSASLSQNDQLSRSWWKQYKPSLDTNFIKYSEPYRKWKLLNKEKKIMIDYKHSNQGIINSSPDENMAELNMVSQKLDNAKNYNYKRKCNSGNFLSRNMVGSESSHNSRWNPNRYSIKEVHTKKNTNSSDLKNNWKEKNNQFKSLGKSYNAKKMNTEYSNLNTAMITQRESLKFSLDKGTLECLVCCEYIKTSHSVWSCLGCFHVLHLNCIKKWAQTSKAGNEWRCPACQHPYTEVPNLYYCFCYKVNNPRYNKYDGAHTCGQVCARVGAYPCVHSCTLLCHPGPCPSCQAQVSRNCACGKTTRVVQCKQTGTFLCDKLCEKLLNCQLHHCQDLCHEEECKKCEDIILQECYCGHQNQEVRCTSETAWRKKYSCGQICGRMLDCKNHTCLEICHSGDCKPCMLTPDKISSCPCGRAPLSSDSRQTCLDPIPLCEAICEKPLACGLADDPHKCTKICHAGSCSECPLETLVRCRCGHMDIQVKCTSLSTSTETRCLKKCTKKRDCGKHKCNEPCCIIQEHICPLPCRRMLSCGQHRCESNCHKGRCDPCWRSSFDELTCECGYSIRYPPIPCGARKPTCDQVCSRQHSCSHPVLHTCHSEAECPPCTVLCSKWCFGKHEMRKTIPCHQKDFSCGRPCGKELPCGKHSCLLPCHKGACLQDGKTCSQPCATPRSSCNHPCRSPCHEGICPDTPCKEKVLVSCQCKLRSTTRTCSETSRDYQRIASSLLASKMAEMQRGATIDIQDILNNRNVNLKTLECTEECRLAERNRRMMLGLQIKNPNTSTKLHPRYSDFLKQWARKDSCFISNIHDKLTELVRLSRQSKQKFRSYSFPVMNKEKRQVVHEMCEQFGVESQAYDPEPNRNVVATADKEKCWLPSMSVLEVIQRESGQRKVPVPSFIFKSVRHD